MAKDKVVIRWNTKCAFNGKEQPVARKTIDPPTPESLAAGQEIRVKFSSRWYNAYVVEPWTKKTKAGKNTNVSPAKEHVDIPAPLPAKKKKEDDMYKKHLEDKAKRESGWRMLRLGGGNKRGGDEEAGGDDKNESEGGVREMKGGEKEKTREVQGLNTKEKGGQKGKQKIRGEGVQETVEERENKREKRGEVERPDKQKRGKNEKERQEMEKWEKEQEKKREEEKRREREKWERDQEKRREEERRVREKREREQEKRREEDERREREKREREEAKRREQIERIEREDREREEEYEGELAFQNEDLLGIDIWDWPLANAVAPNHYGSQGQVVEAIRRMETTLNSFMLETRATLQNLADRVKNLEAAATPPSTPPSGATVTRSTTRSTPPTCTKTTNEPQSVNVLTPTSKKAVLAVLRTSTQRHKAALKMIRLKFTKEELAASNCSGKHGKDKLDQTRLGLVKKIVFEQFPPDKDNGETEEDVWKEICKKIDGKCRTTKFYQGNMKPS